MRTLIYDTVKDYANSKGYIFYYGLKQYQNLVDIDKSLIGKTIIYMAPIVENNRFDYSFWNKKETAEVLIYVAQLGDINDDYDADKFNQRIRNIKTIINEMCKEMFCSTFKPISSNIKEGVNEFDVNLDGLYINCTIEKR